MATLEGNLARRTGSLVEEVLHSTLPTYAAGMGVGSHSAAWRAGELTNWLHDAFVTFLAPVLVATWELRYLEIDRN